MRNAKVREVSETWEHDGETVTLVRLEGFDDPHTDLELSMSELPTRLELIKNGWKRREADTIGVCP